MIIRKSTLFNVFIYAMIAFLSVFIINKAFSQVNLSDVEVMGSEKDFDSLQPYEVYESFEASGTVIKSDTEGAYVLTVWHVVTKEPERKYLWPKIMVRRFGKKAIQAKCILVCPIRDLAMLWVAIPNAQVSPVAKELVKDDVAWTSGFPKGEYYERKIKWKKSYSDGLEGFYGEVIEGHSGGGVFNKEGYLIGVVNASDYIETYATCGKPLTDFIEQAFKKHYTQCSTGNCSNGGYVQPRRGGFYAPQRGVQPRVIIQQPQIVQPPPRPKPRTQRPITPQKEVLVGSCKDCVKLKERLKELESKIPNIDENELTARILAKIPPVDKNDIIKTISGMIPTSDDILKELPPIRVTHIDKTGKVLDALDVKLGGELPLRFNIIPDSKIK